MKDGKPDIADKIAARIPSTHESLVGANMTRADIAARIRRELRKAEKRAARAEAECESCLTSYSEMVGIAFRFEKLLRRARHHLSAINPLGEEIDAALSPAPAAENLDALIEQARAVTMTPEQAEAQRQSFARGNVAIDNQSDSRKTIPAPSPDKENGR